MQHSLRSPEAWHSDEATVLVIDDETMIRELIHRILEPKVCRVAQAASAEEGLRIIEAGAPPIDVVFTDLKMPAGLDGWDVIEVLAKYYPDLPIGVISGYGWTARGEETSPARHPRLGVWFLQKPFTEATLVGLASTLIADARATRARAQAQRHRAGGVRSTNTLIREQHVELRKRLDLVAAAWDLRRRLPSNDGQLAEG
jgi:DNA-binding NtrC family response regulator